jgi:hypothetical protein
MMRQHDLKFLLAMAAAIALVGWNSSTARAGFLSQLEGLQLSNGAIHQWRFEGADGASRQDDHGSRNVSLLTAAGEGGMGANDVNMTPADTTDDVPWSYPAGDVNLIGYNAGYDGAGVSQAYKPQSVVANSTFAAEILAQRRSGAGLYAPSFTTPSMMTIETVIQPGAYNDVAGGSLHYVLQTRPGTGRGYYLAQQQPDGSRGVAGSLVAAIGDPLAPLASRPRIVGDHADTGDWYYVAATYDLSGSNAIVSAYYANLTTGGPLIQSQNSFAFTQVIGAGLVNATGLAGVGLFVRPGANVLAQEFFNGAIDNLTVYESKLSAEAIAQHHRALTIVGVPEPTSLALAALGGAVFALTRRRG